MTIRFERAQALFNEHDDTGEALAEAELEFQTLLKQMPNFPQAIAYLGLIALDRMNSPLADSLFKASLTIDSTCAEARVGRAQLLRRNKLWQAGYAEARHAVTLAPNSIMARWELVSQLLHRAEAPVTETEQREAAPHLLKLIELDSNDRQAHLDLAVIYEHSKMWNDAANHYREVLRIGQLPEDMDVWVFEIHQDAARCFENLGDYDEAIKDLQLYLANLKEFQYPDESTKRIEQKIEQLQQRKRH